MNEISHIAHKRKPSISDFQKTLRDVGVRKTLNLENPPFLLKKRLSFPCLMRKRGSPLKTHKKTKIFASSALF